MTQHNKAAGEGLTPILERVTAAAAGGAILLGSCALVGWALDVEALRSLGQPVSMNPMVASAFIAIGVALFLRRRERAGRVAVVISKVLGGAVAAVGALGVAKYLGFGPNVDTLLFPEKLHGNVIAPNTAICLLLIGTAVFVLDMRTRRRSRPAATLAWCAGGIALLAVLGYGIAILAMYRLGPYIAMALNTAAGLLVLSIGILTARSDGPVASLAGRWSMGRTIIASFAACVLMLIVVGSGAYHSTTQLITDNRRDEMIRAEMLEISELLSSIKDAETGQRGFLLTGEQSYLAPYEQALGQIEAHIQTLRQSMADRPSRQADLARLESFIARKLEELSRTVALRRDQGFDASVQVVRSGEGKALMERIRAATEDMRDADRSAEQAVQAEQETVSRQTVRLIWFGTLLTPVLVLVAGFQIRRDMVARRRAEDQLREAEARYRLLVEGVKDYAVIMLDSDGRVASWNTGAQRIKGYSAEEILGRHFSQFYPTEEVERGKPAAELRTVRQQGRYEEEGWRVRKDGSRFWANVVMTAMVDKDGQFRGFAKVTRDITERKRAEDEKKRLTQAVQQHAAQLEAANQELEAFCYSVSHDLRAPLRSIDGFSQALLEDYGKALEPEAVDFLQRVRDATRRMAQLIDDLLNLSRVTRADLSRSPVDLSAMARAVAEDLQKTQPDRAVEFVIADGLTAEGDPRLLRVVLDNLLGNAWKFTAKCDGARIEFAAAGTNGSRQFFVRDNGAGFDMTYAHKLFGAFQRLHGNGEFAGTGVGLATVQRIIHRHGGKVSAEGEVGKGATFRFNL